MFCEKDYQLQALHAVKNQIPNYLNPANQNILWRSKAVVLAVPPSVVALTDFHGASHNKTNTQRL